MHVNPECIFCKIVSGAIPSIKVAETDSAYAFMDIGPIARGHLLIIPRAHYGDIFQMPPAEVAAIYELAARLAPVLRDVVGAEGLNVLQNNGSVAGQVVMHLHVHLIPRWADDGLKWPWPARKADSAELQQIAEAVSIRL